MNMYVERDEAQMPPLSATLSVSCPIQADGPLQSQRLAAKAVECWFFLINR